MCIIAVKWSDKTIEKSVLETCFENNPDGAGYMWADNGKVIVHKGFFTFKDLWEDYKTHRLLNRNVVFHFRIASSGDVDVNNCHPFPITPKLRAYLNLKKITSAVPCLCHNGVISELSFFGSKLSDTVLFTEKLAKCRNLYDPKNFPTGFNRFAILNPDGSVNLYGDGWVKGEDGNQFSNTSFRVARSVFGLANTCKYDINDDPYAYADVCPVCREYLEEMLINDAVYYYCGACGTLFDEFHNQCKIVPVNKEEML